MLSKIRKGRFSFPIQTQVSLLVHQFRVLLQSCEKHGASPVVNEKNMKSALT